MESGRRAGGPGLGAVMAGSAASCSVWSGGGRGRGREEATGRRPLGEQDKPCVC